MMREVIGNIWDYPADYICLTTNGTLKKDGSGVMGRGVAFQAKQKFPFISRTLGECLTKHGNKVSTLIRKKGKYGILSFPVKHQWYEKADIDLIIRSANELKLLAETFPDVIFALPKPGCGNGGLEWSVVKEKIHYLLPDNVHIVDLK